MAEEEICLGICYADNQLFYSVNDPGSPSALQHIGAFDVNFDVQQAIVSGKGEGFVGIKHSLNNLKEQYHCNSVRLMSPATEECWSILPRSVYEDSEEREDHIRVLMQNIERNNIEAVWYPLSNIDYRLLLVRNSATMQGFRQLLGDFSHAEYVAEFEIGTEWQQHTHINGSYLAVHCEKNYISVSSCLLGKLRGSTYIRFDHRSDLPYLWNLYSSRLPWMEGIQEQIYLYGLHAQSINEVLNPYLDDSGDVYLMNSLDVMQVDAPEKTYGFQLECAFPAVLLSLNYDQKSTEQLHENPYGKT